MQLTTTQKEVSVTLTLTEDEATLMHSIMSAAFYYNPDDSEEELFAQRLLSLLEPVVMY